MNPWNHPLCGSAIYCAMNFDESLDKSRAVGCNKRSALHRMLATHPAQCPLVIAPYMSCRNDGLLGYPT